MGNSKLLAELKTEDYHIELFINSDKTEASLRVPRLTVGTSLPFDKLLELLESNNIKNGVDKNMLKELVEKSSAAELQASDTVAHVVARGKPAKHSYNGYINFLVTPSAEDAQFTVSNSEVIDYKNTNLIQNVSAEQHLATIVQPPEAENGMDVHGDAIVATTGVPVKPKVSANLTLDGDKIYASCNGRFIKSGDELSVSAVYNVRGDVDLTIGNINFIGAVNIHKDVLDEFSVFAKEALEVNGVVGAANVESDKSIKINGGMNGKGKGFVRCQGTVDAKYLNEVTAVSWGDITVQKSIMNSVVKTKGKISIVNGSIIGGEVSALMGIDVAFIGSDLGTMTSVIAGQDYEMQDRIKAYEAQLLELGQEIDRIDHIIGPILVNKAKLLALPVEKKKALKGLLEQLRRNNEEKTRIRNECEALQKESAKTSVREIRVRKVLYSGVKVTIGNCKRLIKTEIKGPIRLLEDLDNDSIAITNLTV